MDDNPHAPARANDGTAGQAGGGFPDAARRGRGAAIAVLGAGCRLPGDADSPAALWQLLADGRDAVGELSSDRAELSAGADSQFRPWGGFLRNVSGFDADFFGVSGREAEVLDPQHRLLLEVAWEAFEHAGFRPESLNGMPVGVFTGMSYHDYMDGLTGHPRELEGSVLTNGHCVAPGRISYLLGLRGPSLSLDTACSSSLVALHLAAQSLNAGECELALAGGVSLILQPRTTQSFARMGMLSAAGHCHAFDAAADGFVRGEGCGVVVLKRLADAVRAGDRVLAVLRGSAVNQDGASEGLAAPSSDAQRALYIRALSAAGVDPCDVGMVETHGTGTPVGDPAEFASLAAVYGERRTDGGRCALTSVKTNLGHLEPAAGIAGLIKVIGSLGRGLIPPNLHFTDWNPACRPEGTRLFVPTRLVEWPVRSGSRLASVSSFGFAGTNAHAVLEQPPTSRSRGGRGRQKPAVPPPSPAPEVFLVPASSTAVLPDAALRLAEWLEGGGASVPLRDVAHTLAMRRSPGRGRLGVVADSHGRLAESLRMYAAGQAGPHVVTGSVGSGISRRPVWVFSGQGSQWPGMGSGLLGTVPAFASALAEVDELITAEAGFSVLDVVRRGRPVSGCGRVQPVLFALQIALAAAWRGHGVEPAGVIGHSMGEVAAAVVAGALSLPDGVRVICRRSALLERIAGKGAMASVELDAETVEAEIAAVGADPDTPAGQVSVAVLGAPGATVVAGDTARVHRMVEDWQARGVPASTVAVDVASHSPQVDPLLDDLRAALVDLTPTSPHLPFYSTVLDDPNGRPAFDAGYWCENLRRPVRFAAAVAAAAADRHPLYVEISPHPVVSRALTRSLAAPNDQATEPVVLPTLLRDEDELATLRVQLAALHCAGGTVDWSVLYADAQLAEVPTIAFDRTRHFTRPEIPRPRSEASPAGADADPLPGRRTEIPGTPHRLCWHGDTGISRLPWLADHQVYGSVALPGAVHCAIALSCACDAFNAGPDEVEVADLRFLELLRLTERTPVSTTVTLTDADHAQCEIYARGEKDTWVLQATAVLRRRAPVPRSSLSSVGSLASGHPRRLDPRTLYESLRARGLTHGPAFAGVTGLRGAEDGESYWAQVEVPQEARRSVPTSLRVHPVLIDLCAQLVAARLIEEADSGTLLPVGMRDLRVLGDPATTVYCHSHIAETSDDALTGNVQLLDQAGSPVLSIDGLKFTRRAATNSKAVDSWFSGIRWSESPRRTPSRDVSAPTTLIISESGQDAESSRALARAIESAGGKAEVWKPPPAHEGLQRLTASLVARLGASEEPPRVVAVLCRQDGDGDGEAGHDPAAVGLRQVRLLLAAAQAITGVAAGSVRLYAVTRGARPVRPGDTADPAQGALRGVVRVLALEHPELQATLVDADARSGPDTGKGGDRAALRELAHELMSYQVPDTEDLEDEVALRGGARHVARLERTPLAKGERVLAARMVRSGEDGFRLRVRRPGDLTSLRLAESPRIVPGAGEVEVRVTATGLNFRDVLIALGMLPDAGAGAGATGAFDGIGFECAGVVTAVGPGVERFCVGDDVLAVSLEGGAFASFVTLPARAVASIPPGLGAVAAAGLPIPFLTAWYALRHVARLAPGERVLIHSATGGTGLAAIAVARHLGAEVLATAGSAEKRGHLLAMGITEVMDSRTLDFRDQTRETTGGEGVDVVLNSLSGAAIRAGLETLRPFGRFIELGVRDILSDGLLGLSPLRHNITFRTVDLIELQRSQPEVFDTVLREVLGQFTAGELAPLHSTTFPITAASQAFRLMAGARHLGKVVLTTPAKGETVAVLPAGPVTARRDGAYIITGGLRGVGLATAQWLARQGAGHLVLNGRTTPTPEATATLRDLDAQGTKITVVLGDIAEQQTAERLVAAAGKQPWPLRGVVHGAMVLADAAVTTLDEERLHKAWKPKADGAWHLHRATASHRLDWFVVHSSMASLLGNPGQAGYAAANAWLDAFAAWRTALGLPTLAVNWGPWGEIGAATDFARRGYRTIPTEMGFQALQELLVHGSVQAGVIPGDAGTWIPRAGWGRDFFSLVRPDGDAGASGSEESPGELVERLRSMPAGTAQRRALETFLAEHIRAVLRIGATRIDPQTPLRSLGFDSLLATEVRARIEPVLGVRLAGDFVWRHRTLAALAEGLSERLGLVPS
ncbi:type I polyketide synthase [Streptomyces sp. CMB-StM0423]|uniref:type I polyketide synthase n=1 Tax=Streptomyces sp. CMB-StM0423 TaxID=2059884 RepID=UPI000C6FDAC6|nr:type I polyketide synthase [Streptomyces sp. CMB-StM0423]AUH41181.1 polyketide synthase [Streptomyces sp. CMB-StM0423]